MAKRGPDELRRAAEERLAEERQAAPTDRPAAADTLRMLHELQVHQIELELQNEELRASRHELEASLARYAELFDFAPIGYFQVGSDGRVREVNFAGARLLGVARRQIVGRPLEAFVAERDQPAFRQFLGRALAPLDEDDPTVVAEFALRVERGPAVQARVTGACLVGAARTALVAVEDVTARKQAEEELRVEARRRDEFLAALSHELRNPLAPIRNGIYLLQRTIAVDGRGRAALAVIDRQVTHLTRIVEDLLDVTRVMRGKIRLQRERVDLGAQVLRTVEDHRPAFEAAGVRLECAIDPGPCWVDADVSRLAQALGNLLGNALKFTSRGGVVTVEVKPEGAAARLVVRDDGVGIAPEDLALIFEPFTQGKQTLDRSPGGLGLGLPMVQGLVELHGGRVEARSAGPGRGAEFVIRLPRLVAPVEQADVPHPLGLGGRRRVLVIDDNADAATSLRDILELGGQEVQVALDGPSGVAAAHAFRPEIVICDIGLPRMDGYQVARALRADAALQGARLVAMSGYAAPEDVERARAAGFDRHVAKPPTMERLASIFDEQVTGGARPVETTPGP